MEINETFVSHQGEISVGKFCFFIRLAKCSLNCIFCDTKYAHGNGINIDPKELAEQAHNFPRVVITGGEPLLQNDEIVKLINWTIKKNPDVQFEIETNGTIRPTGLNKFTNIQYNVSVKLKNSGNDYSSRINPKAIKWFIDNKANFKFVVSNEDDIDEVKLLSGTFNIPNNLIYLMPEGKTKEEQLEKMEGIIEFARYFGYNFSPRLHVLIYGDKRGV